jgi:hypothetical protein
LYSKFSNKRPVATGLDRFFLRCGPIRTGPKRSGYGPLISGSVYTGCGCQLPRFEVKNRTRLDFKTLAMTRFKSCESFNHTNINLCIVKDTPNYMSEKQTTNLCSLKKRTLQTFLVDGLCIVVFCIQSKGLGAENSETPGYPTHVPINVHIQTS